MEEKKIQLTIDRHVVEVNPDMTLLEAAEVAAEYNEKFGEPEAE